MMFAAGWIVGALVGVVLVLGGVVAWALPGLFTPYDRREP